MTATGWTAEAGTETRPQRRETAVSINFPLTHRGRPSGAARGNPKRTGVSRSGLVEFGLAALVAIVGVTSVTEWCVTGILDQIQAPAEFVRTDVPGTVSVVLTQVGQHVVYLEGDDPTAVSASEVVVTGADGTAVSVRPYALDLRYDVPDRPGTLGTAIAMFDAARTGSYSVGTGATVADPRARLAVGDDLAPATVRAVVLPSLAALLSVLAALALAARSVSRRKRRFDL